jgi:hypothetical protein
MKKAFIPDPLPPPKKNDFRIREYDAQPGVDQGSFTLEKFDGKHWFDIRSIRFGQKYGLNSREVAFKYMLLYEAQEKNNVQA